MKSCFLVGLILLIPVQLWSQTVRFRTNLGDIDVNLLPESAPQTVANFLKYMNRGSYNNSFFHRSVANFIIQGGGFQFTNGQPAEIPSDAPVRNEYRISNTRGTIAMAKLGNDPNSATNQWFFNLANNASNLNTQNGGFTVFGRVANSAGLAVMDRIAAVPVYNAGSPFESIPLQNYRSGTVTAANLIMVNSISIVEPTPAISQNGVTSAGSFGGFTSGAPGSFLEIYGTNLATSTRSWTSGDFTDGRAPTSLDEVSVTVNGEPAYVAYISPTQVNIQVPANVPDASAAQVIVTSKGQASSPASIEIKPLSAGLLAPSTFKVGDKQYVAAVHSTNGAFVSNGQVPDVPAAPATRGETLVFYGIGFGPVEGTPVAGQISYGITRLSTPVEFYIGDVAAEVTYAGFAPDLVGLYQFNVTVPSGAPSGDQPLRVVLGGQNLTQSLFLPVQQ